MAEKSTILIQQLPIDVQVHILQFIPFKNWPLASELLPLALSQPTTWKKCNIDRLEILEDEVVQLITHHVQHIQVLSWNCAIWNCKISIGDFLQNFVQLECLNLASNEKITDILFLSNLKNLKRLNLAGCTGIDTEQFDVIFPTLQQITDLDVSECNVTKECIINLLHNRPNGERLSYLNVRDCFSIEIEELGDFDEDCVEVVEFCPLLTFASCHEWSANLNAHKELLMCPAALEILDEMIQD